MKYRLVIFDMDGTLLYTLEDLTDALNHALHLNGFPTKTMKEVRSYVGNGIRNEVRCSLPSDTNVSIQQKVYEDFSAYYNVHCNDHTRPYEGILDLLRKLRNDGVLTAVVSNKGDYAVQELDKQYFDGLLDAGVGEREDEGIARKPAPDTVNAVLNKLHTDRKDAVYVGDSEVDIKTALNAHMDSIIVDWGYRDRSDLIKDGAKKIVSAPEELYECLK
ncbi:MAG: HAD family hydrolase [Erysipelotrichaceae bacterium]|nr:HAD family hydrolase [Erysipelotrichaceae bacterium]